MSYIEGSYPWVSPSNDLVRFRRTVSRRTGRPAAGRRTNPCRDRPTGRLADRRHADGYASGERMFRDEQAGNHPFSRQRYGLRPLRQRLEGQGRDDRAHRVRLGRHRVRYDRSKGARAPLFTVDYVPTERAPHADRPRGGGRRRGHAALAPKATVVVYESTNKAPDLGPWELAVSGTAPGGLPEVITSSWGSCEPDTGMGSSYYQTEESIFDEAAAQGQTIFVASGDDGSEGCLDQTQSKRLAADDPATTPS